MKRFITLLSIFAIMLANPSSAFAQSRDIGDIFGDIFKDKREGQNQGQYPSQSIIENIPVNIRYDVGANGIPAQAVLIVTAYAPPAPNVRRSSPLMIGETRILLDGLDAPLQLVIAAPSAVTNNIDYARIEAKIVDDHGTTIYELRQSGEYRGADIPTLFLNRIGDTSHPHDNSGSPQTVRGTVELNDASPLVRGSTLIVRFREDGLVGGNHSSVVGETRLSLDNKTAPFAFSFQHTAQNRNQMPLVIEAWIEDWAGRKTHTLPQAMAYNGPDISYRLPLRQAVPNPPVPPTPSSERFLKGEARFNAYKGLPAGSLLIASLEYNNNSSRPVNLAQTTVRLDGLSGNVPFTLDLLDQRIVPTSSGAVIRVRIESKTGQVFFSNPGGTPLIEGFNAVNLQASPEY